MKYEENMCTHIIVNKTKIQNSASAVLITFDLILQTFNTENMMYVERTKRQMENKHTRRAYRRLTCKRTMTTDLDIHCREPIKVCIWRRR